MTAAPAVYGGRAGVSIRGPFAICGDGLCVGRDSGPAVAPDYTAPFPFTGGTIERVAVDVSGDHHVDHQKRVVAHLTRD